MKQTVANIKALLLIAILARTALPIQAIAAILRESDAVAITELMQERLKVDDLSVSFVSEGKFAIAFWKAADGHAAGEALARKNADDWTIVKQISGAFRNARMLEDLGVPAAQAKALVSDLATTGH